MRIVTTLGDGIDELKTGERSIPEPKPNQIILKMTAASLNYRDLLVIGGVGTWKPSTQRIPLSDGVGEVIAVGPAVSRFAVGDRAAGIFLPHWLDGELTAEKYHSPLGGATTDGVLAQYIAFDQESAVKAPDSLSAEESATLPVAALTAWHAVARRSRVQPGDTVLIQGTGGVSLFAAQFVRALGGLPIVISSSNEKLEKIRDLLGQVETVNYKTFPAWEDQVLKLTSGKGVDHVIETVGGENLNRSLNCVKISGTISFIGLIAGLSAPINTYQFVTKNVQIHGIETGSREMFEEVNSSIDRHQIKPVIDKVFPVDNIRDALRYLESGQHFGKVVLKF